MISVIVPALNESANIRPLIDKLILQFQQPCEIIIVDDHSSDDTYEQVEQLNLPNVYAIRLSRRSGSHVALRAGLLQATGDAVLCISADGQDNPAVINQMLSKWTAGQQIVWALREKRENEAFMQKYFSLAFYSLLRMLVVEQARNIDLARADFYLLDRLVVDSINSCPERNSSLFGLIAWMGFRQDYVEYERLERLSGKSKWNFRSRLRLAKDWIIAFSGLPLKMMTWIGFSVAVLGLLYAGFIFNRALTGYPVQGWASLMILVLVLGGFQMTMAGITGEYLWRTLDETRNRPLFFVEKNSAKRFQKQLSQSINHH
jgi:polyisoprenyl-phosphate glycosyltransferase